MEIADDSTLVDFDADEAVAAVRREGGDAVHLCVEYTPEGFHTLYADELTTSLYADDPDEMRDHFEDVHVDFTERDLFSDVFRGAGGVRLFVTYMDHVVLVRVLVGQQGVFLTADPDADVTRLVEAVEAELE